MNQKLKITLGWVGLLASIIIFTRIAVALFMMTMFAGLAGNSSYVSDASAVAFMPEVISLFLMWQFTRLIQSKKHINGFILLALLIVVICFILIPLDSLKSLNGASDAEIPRSLWYEVTR